MARPVGAVGRFVRWCRRNPAVTGLTAVVAVLLLSATAVSTSLATWALGERDRANGERDLADARTRDVEESGEKLEQTLRAQPGAATARGGQRFSVHPPTPPEDPGNRGDLGTRAAPSERLRSCFVMEAIGDPLNAAQLRNRSSPALIAAVGLDPIRRERAVQAISDRMNDGSLSLSHRAAVACVTLELADAKSSVAHQAEDIIIQAIANGNKSSQDIALRDWLHDHLDVFSPASTARLLAKMLEKEADSPSGVRYQLAWGLASVAGRLPPPDTAAVCARRHGY